MGTISNIEALSDNKHTHADEGFLLNGVPQASPKKLWLLVVTIAYYPNGKLAYVHVSIGGILLIALLAGVSPWSQIAPLLKGLLHTP
jgi:hypothetical protein